MVDYMLNKEIEYQISTACCILNNQEPFKPLPINTVTWFKHQDFLGYNKYAEAGQTFLDNSVFL